MLYFVIGGLWIGLVILVWTSWRRMAARERTLERLMSSTTTDNNEVRVVVVSGRSLSRPWRYLPWAVSVLLAVSLWLVFGWSLPYAGATALVVGLLGSQLEGFLAKRHEARLENQLADAIDIMVGALGAGAGVGAAIESAITETTSPLRPLLVEMSGRIRLGDDPIEVFRSLAEKIPLETFLLFSSALSVHWEVGGRLAPTLATVGRTIRDRIDVSRRIQSNIAQSQFSTFAILGLIYLIALIVWRNGPEAMQDFVNSSVGSWFIAGSIVMQAVGIFWMDVISKPRF
ncbi:MAG: type II secretion system F family protein [Pirellulaceae bacterium]|nr:type II secretion system F family protein [Pirellulaceae bacterium]